MPILTSFIVYSIPRTHSSSYIHCTWYSRLSLQVCISSNWEQSLWLRTGFERSIVGYNTVNIPFSYIIYYMAGSSHFITSPNLIWVIRSRRIGWAVNVACIGERCAYRDSVGKPEGRRQRRTPTHRWEDNIKMHLREVGWRGVNWIEQAQDRDRWRVFVYAIMNLRVQ